MALTPEEQALLDLEKQMAEQGSETTVETAMGEELPSGEDASVATGTGGSGGSATQAPAQKAAVAPTGEPTYAPPPPPPPAPDDMGLDDDIMGYAKDWLGQPNRYLSDLATATREAGERRLSQEEDESLRRIQEWAAERGLVGSSYEGDQLVQAEDRRLSRAAEQERDLLEMLTAYESMDKTAAGQFALQAAERGDTAGLERYLAELEGYRVGEGVQSQRDDIALRRDALMQEAELEGRKLTMEEAETYARIDHNISLLEEARAQRLQDYGLAQDELDLRAEEIRTSAAAENRRISLAESQHQAEVEFRAEQIRQGDESLSIEAARNQAEQEIAYAEIEERRSQRLQNLGLAKDELELRAEEIRLNAQLRGDEISLQRARDEAEIAYRAEQVRIQDKSLSLEEARNVAESEFRMSQLVQQREIEEARMAQQAQQFADELGITRLEMEQRMDMFSKTHAENVAARLQQESQYARGLEDSAAQRAMEYDLRNRALAIQSQGQGMENAWRTAALAQEKELRNRAMDLEAQGMSADNAYRYAALASDERLRSRALDLQKEGLDMEDAWRKAEREWRSSEAVLDRAHELDLDAKQQERLIALLAALGIDIKGFGDGRNGGGDGSGKGDGSGETGTGDNGENGDDGGSGSKEDERIEGEKEAVQQGETGTSYEGVQDVGTPATHQIVIDAPTMRAITGQSGAAEATQSQADAMRYVRDLLAKGDLTTAERLFSQMDPSYQKILVNTLVNGVNTVTKPGYDGQAYNAEMYPAMHAPATIDFLDRYFG